MTAAERANKLATLFSGAKCDIKDKPTQKRPCYCDYIFHPEGC